MQNFSTSLSANTSNTVDIEASAIEDFGTQASSYHLEDSRFTRRDVHRSRTIERNRQRRFKHQERTDYL